MSAGAALPIQLTLLVRAYCHLCEEMAHALAPLAAAHHADVVTIDVDAHPPLEAAHGDRVPVLFLGPVEAGVELCHYHLDATRVAHALANVSATSAARAQN